MDIYSIIHDSYKKLSNDLEIKKSLFLNVLHNNIDILAKNAGKWFKDDIPKEYLEVLSSLMNISISYYEQTTTSHESGKEYIFEKFNPLDIINEVNDDFTKIIKLNNIKIKSQKDICIKTSKKILKESLLHIFLSISQFMNKNSNCLIKIKQVKLNIVFELLFKNLNKNLPISSNLTKVFFSDNRGNESEKNIRVGLKVAVENLKRIGAYVNINSKVGNLLLTINFLSNEFLSTVSDIRDKNENVNTENKSGLIMLSFFDRITEMVIFENLHDQGYETKLFDIEDLNLFLENKENKSIIIDYKNITEHYSDIEEFIKQVDIEQKILIVQSSDDNLNLENKYKNIFIVKVPFELNNIIEIIEN